MKTNATILKIFIPLFFFVTHTAAQDQRSFDQNSSRSNHFNNIPAYGFNFSFSPVYSTSLNNANDSLLFRGSGGGIKFGGDYFFGNAGIGLSSGFGSSSPDDNAINRFLQKTNVPMDQLLITKSNQQNMYLLLGPSLRFGNSVELLLHAKGGLFINNGGLVMIQQKGAVRAAYRNESTNKSIYPGFQTGLNIQYNTKSDVWSFGVGADYMGTKAEVNNYDSRRGGGIEGLKFTKSISDLVAGITIRYNIHSTREQGSGLATGRLLPTVNKKELSTGMATGRVLPTVNKREIISSRDAQSGLATGRVLPTVNKKEIAIDEQGVHKTLSQGCGSVTLKNTKADGTTEEMTFSCPEDAVAYAEKITPGKQKQGLPSNFRTVANEGRDRGIISGRLTWTSSNGLGIITNKSISRGSSITMNSQTSNTRSTPNNSFGTLVRMSAREASTGMATGKRSREASTGMATGKLYETVFEDGQLDVCNPCVADVKANRKYKGTMGTAQNNPLYQEKVSGGIDDDCDGIAGIDITLLDIASGAVVAKTKTESCGDFFFANVPTGDYILKLNGSFVAKKGYDVYLKSKTDLLGSIQLADDAAQLMINPDGTNEMSQKAGISTSRSNIRTKSISIIEADLDGDGEFESCKAMDIFSDGSTSDITNDAKTAQGRKNIILDGNALQMRRRVEVLKSNKQGDQNANRNLSSIIVATGDLDGDGKAGAINTSHSNLKALKVTATFSDGSTQDVTNALAINTSHSNIKQYSIAVADMDGDGMADAIINTSRSNIKSQRVAADDGNDDGEGIIKTKTKSNQSNDRIIGGDVDGDGDGIIKTKTKSNQSNDRISGVDLDGDEVNEVINTSHSNLKVLRVAAGDIDGDGRAETVVGGFIPGGSVVSAAKMPGNPIPGIDVKLGKNPGSGGMITVTSNEDGQFEFTNIEAGDYLISMEQNILIDDETFITVERSSAKNINTSEDNLGGDKTVVRGWNPTIKGNLKNSNTNEANLKNVASINKEVKVSASQNSQTLRSILIEADLDGDGEYETDVTNQLNDEITIDENGQISPQMKAGVSTSRSNIRTRSSLFAKGDGMYVSYGRAVVNNKEVDVKSVLKTKHDTVKNSIGNIR